MKYLLLFSLLLFAPLTMADALPAATPPTNWTELGILVAIGFVFAGVFVWIRRRPGAAAKVQAEALELAHKVLAHKQREAKPAAPTSDITPPWEKK